MSIPMKLATVKSGKYKGEIVAIIEDCGNGKAICELSQKEFELTNLHLWKSVNSVKVNKDGTVETT